MSNKLFGDLMKQAQAMQERIKVLQEEVGGKTVEASAGGGMVTVTANGRLEIIAVRIEPDVLQAADREMLQDLIAAATNEALRKAQALMAEEMRKITGGLPLPGMFA